MFLLAALLVCGHGSTATPEDPNTALTGVYSECILGMDWSCLQRRSLLFVDRLARAESYPLFPGLVLVRTAPTPEPLETTTLDRMDGDSLHDMMDDAVALFFEEHVVRVEIPGWLKTEGRAMGDIDFYFGDGVEARGKKKKKKKLLKKILLLGLLLIAAKKMLLLPMMMGMMKIAAIKGLLMGFISLIMSKLMILKKLQQKMKSGGGMMSSGGWMSSGSGGSSGAGGGWPSSGSGGGGGGGGMGGGGGGWDRSLSSHDLAYSSYTQESKA